MKSASSGPARSVSRRLTRPRPAATAAGMIVASSATKIRKTNTTPSTIRMATNCQLAKAFLSPRTTSSMGLRFINSNDVPRLLRRDAVIGDTFDRDHLRHLVQPAAQALADAILQSLAVDGRVV